MDPGAPTLHAVHARRALSPGISEADVRRLGLTVTTQAGRFVQRVSDVWLEQQIDDRWIAAYRIVSTGGEPRVSELRIFPAEPDFVTRPKGEWSGCWKGVEATAPRQRLTMQIVRRVRLQSVLPKTREILRALAQQHGRGRIAPVERFGLSLPPAKEKVGRGRPSKGDEFYAGIAAAYVGALAAGRSPVREIAKQHRERSDGCVRGWIHRARDGGFLQGRQQGVAYGQLSDKAIFILEAMKKQPRKSRREKGGQRSAAKADRRRASTHRRP